MAQWIDPATGDVYEYDDTQGDYGLWDGNNPGNDTPGTSGDFFDYAKYMQGLGEWDGTTTPDNRDTSFINYANSLGGGDSGGAGSGIGSALSRLLSGINSPLGMGLLGAGLGSINGSRQTGNTTVTSEPWAAQQPYLLDLFNRAQKATNQASSANPMETQATGQMQTAAAGNLTNPMLGMNNPFLQNQIDMSSKDIMNGLQSQYATANRQAGSFGNTGVAEQFGKTAADALARNSNSMRMQDYTQQQQLNESDVGRRMGAVNNLYQVGRQQRQNAFEPLNNYSNLIRGSYGSSQTTPNFTNPFAGALGGGLLGTQLYKMMGN